MRLSVREAEVLTIIARCEAIGFHVLEQHLEGRIPVDELEVIVDRLRDRRLVHVMPARRSHTLSTTGEGREAAVANLGLAEASRA